MYWTPEEVERLLSFRWDEVIPGRPANNNPAVFREVLNSQIARGVGQAEWDLLVSHLLEYAPRVTSHQDALDLAERVRTAARNLRSRLWSLLQTRLEELRREERVRPGKEYQNFRRAQVLYLRWYWVDVDRNASCLRVQDHLDVGQLIQLILRLWRMAFMWRDLY